MMLAAERRICDHDGDDAHEDHLGYNLMDSLLRLVVVGRQLGVSQKKLG